MRKVVTQVILPYLLLFGTLTYISNQLHGASGQNVIGPNGDPITITTGLDDVEGILPFIYGQKLEVTRPEVARPTADYTFSYMINMEIKRYQPYNDTWIVNGRNWTVLRNDTM